MGIKEVTPEIIDAFIKGKSDKKRVVNFDYNYYNNYVTVIARNDENERVRTREHLLPFIWATQKGALSLYDGNKPLIKQEMMNHGISCKALRTGDGLDEIERMENGYKFLFYANRPLSYNRFLQFFKNAGVDIYDGSRNFLSCTPIEQYMIQSGVRQFKGFENYDDLLRVVWDIETQGLDPKRHRVNQIGIRSNTGFEHIIHVEGNTEEELNEGEVVAIESFFYWLNKIQPDVVAGHNSENFDWWFLMERCETLGIDFSKVSEEYLGHSMYKKKKPTILKLGGETEYFNQTVCPGVVISDSMHACRRAQAIDSNMKYVNLKYMAEYAKVKKPNRVYIIGDKIGELYNDKTTQYYFNEETGEWRPWTTEDNFVNDNIKRVDGKYIANRYLIDDLYETDKVELRYNEPNFQLAKILPIPYQKVITAGTAGTWKLLLMAWSFENDIAIPLFGKPETFVGGLSRLFKVGYSKDIVKIDFNSYYPCITLTYDVFPDFDITGIFKSLLGYVLDERERYKSLMTKAKKNIKRIKDGLEKTVEISTELEQQIKDVNKYDKLQLPFKIFANSFFGSYGAPHVFPWGNVLSATEITCIARQGLRLVVQWFGERGFESIALDTDGIDMSYTNVDLTYRYVGKGLNRNAVEGKEYVGVEAYVMEFSDLFLRGKMGLGIDDWAKSEANFGRKNRAEIMDDDSLKLVGNTIKSKKMSSYIEKFLNNNIRLLLEDRGKEFLDEYYEYIEKIYNGNIPLRDIASKGKIKKSVKEYKQDSLTLNKAGGQKGRQAWYELVIQDDVRVEMGETIYYVNIGTKKSDGDVKRVPIYQTDADGNFVTKDRIDKNGEIVYSKRGNPPKPLQDKIEIGQEIVLNCVRINKSIIESENDIFGTEEDLFATPIEYNTIKYVEQFNKRIKPLLVCFHPDIRDIILIDNPEKKPTFTTDQCKLCSGLPNKPTDQDILEELFKISDKEIAFWLKKETKPTFSDEIGMKWEEIVEEYEERQELLKNKELLAEVEIYTKIVSEVTNSDIDEFTNTENTPDIFKKLLNFVDINTCGEIISKKHNIKLGDLTDIIDKLFVKEKDDILIESNLSKD